jgi:hypothetical protein
MRIRVYSLEKEGEMLRTEKDLKQKEQWEKMKKRGHLSYVAIDIAIMAGSYFFVRLIHVLCFRLGWLNSPGSTSLVDFVCLAVIGGGIAGELQWSDMKRKFEGDAPGEDSTMI